MKLLVGDDLHLIARRNCIAWAERIQHAEKLLLAIDAGHAAGQRGDGVATPHGDNPNAQRLQRGALTFAQDAEAAGDGTGDPIERGAGDRRRSQQAIDLPACPDDRYIELPAIGLCLGGCGLIAVDRRRRHAGIVKPATQPLRR